MSEINPNFVKPTLIYCDNKGTISMSKNANYSSNTKHIVLRRNFVKDQIAKNIIRIDYLPTKEMLADPLTKPVAKSILIEFVKNIGLK